MTNLLTKILDLSPLSSHNSEHYCEYERCETERLKGHVKGRGARKGENRTLASFVSRNFFLSQLQTLRETSQRLLNHSRKRKTTKSIWVCFFMKKGKVGTLIQENGFSGYFFQNMHLGNLWRNVGGEKGTMDRVAYELSVSSPPWSKKADPELCFAVFHLYIFLWIREESLRHWEPMDRNQLTLEDLSRTYLSMTGQRHLVFHEKWPETLGEVPQGEKFNCGCFFNMSARAPGST